MEAVDLSNVFKFKKLVKSMYQLGLPGVSVVKNLPTNMGFPDSSVGKESACNARDPGLIPGLGRAPGERAWQPTSAFLPRESPWTERSLAGYS